MIMFYAKNEIQGYFNKGTHKLFKFVNLKFAPCFTLNSSAEHKK